jgi:hypothetical protein
MEVEKGGGIPMTLTTIVGGSVPIRTDVRGGSPALFAMPVGVHTTGPVAPAPVTRKSSEDDQMRHAWWYAIIAMTAALLALVGMAVFQYAQTLDTAVTTTAVSAVPAEYAGVSIPQAMRLSDTVVSAVPAQYAGVSIPQIMRLSDTVVSAVPAQYAGVSIPQAMRLSDGS